MSTRRFNVAVLSVLTLSGAAMASDQPGTTYDQWREEQSASTGTACGTPDSGDLISNANITRGQGGLNRITGRLSGGVHPTTGNISFDADVYCIKITDPANFSAITSSTNDAVLALFDSQGRGIAFNDNRTDQATGNTARLTNLLTSALQPGTYFLGVGLNSVGALARYTRPLNAAGGLMFSGPANNIAPVANDPTRRVEVGPLNPNDVLSGWEEQVPGAALPFSYSYTLTLTGVDYHTIPAPGASALLGLGALALRRRRR